MRVELWSIAGRRLKEARELFLRSPCVQTALSPTGRTFACLDADLALNVIDVASGKMVYRKKEFSEPNRLEALAMILGSPRGESGVESENASLLAMGFSTDGRYFAASEKATAARLLGPGTANVVVDIEKGDTISVKGPAQRLLAGGFAFIGPDRFIALNVENTKKSAIVALPLGNVVSEFPMPPGQVTPVSRGRYLVARPFAQHAAAIIDMDKGEVLRGSESPAIDVYDGVIVSERLNGELGLYPIDSNALAASAQLPGSTLGDLQAMAVSEDFRWLAASERTRGAAWNIENGKRVALTRGFRNAAINTDGAFTADFPAFRQIARQLARMDLNQANAPTFREMPAGAAIRQYGDLLVGAKSKGASVTYTVSDARTLQNLWTRTFQDGSPDVLVGSRYGTIVLVWPLDAKGAQAAVKNNPALLQRAKNLKNEGAVFLEVVDARSGAVKGNVLLDTGRGSFAIQAALAAGGWIAIADDQNRILLYSLATGEKKGQVFGGRAAIGAGNGLISVENEDGRLTIYDLNTLEKRAEFVFTARVAFAQFSPDGRKLFVLTADQTAFVLNAPAPASR
jgi:hypothetical protein